MDRAFAEARTALKSKAYFRSVDWEDEAAKPIIDQFSLGGPPASVIADEHGRVMRKLEGPRTTRHMVELLEQSAR